MQLSAQQRSITFRNLVVFTIAIVSCGWLGLGLDALTRPPDSNEPGLGILLWIVAPLLTTLILRSFAGDGWKDLGHRLAFKGNLSAYVLSLLLFPIWATLIVPIGFGMGWLGIPDASMAGVGAFTRAFAFALMPMFFKNIFEEFAWRGYLAPKIYSLVSMNTGGISSSA